MFKNIVFLEFSGPVLKSKRVFGVRMVNGDVLTIQGQMVEIPLQSPGKLRIFLALFLFSTSPSLKSVMATPIKIIFSKL